MKLVSGVLAGFTLAAALSASADAPYVQVPVVLDVRGLNGSHYTSDLTIANLGTTASDVELSFVGTMGPSGGPYLTGTTLPAGRQLYLSSIIGALRYLGAPFPDDGSPILGTLLVRLPGAGDTAPFVGSRVATPNPNALVGGSFGTYSIGIPVGTASSGPTTLIGLRENDAYRTNLALVHAGGGQLRPLGLAVQVFNGETGHPAGAVVPVTLQPGQWMQIPSILANFGITQGWARITVTSGSDRYIAYAVLNDGGVGGGGGTSDGSWIDTNAAEGTIPIVLSAGSYRTELVLARPTGQVSGTFANLWYQSSLSLSGLGFLTQTQVTIPANGQLVIPDILQYLREQGIGIPTTGSQGGTLRVAGALAYARVYSPNPDTVVGGTFGVAYPAIPVSARAHSEAWVYGLRQDDFVRSNLAVVNLATSTGNPATFSVEVLDGPGGRVLRTLGRTLEAGQWYQWDAPLGNTNSRHGAAKVRCRTQSGGPCDFATYGVINDGKAPGTGTSDGSYVPMTRTQ